MSHLPFHTVKYTRPARAETCAMIVRAPSFFLAQEAVRAYEISRGFKVRFPDDVEDDGARWDEAPE